jgi:NAD-dependent dihydropyrimidine dehydrogenase PreA subunit
MYVVTVDDATCEGCGECAEACPASILVVKDGKAVVVDGGDECLGCQSCVLVCNSNSVTMQEY